MEALRRPSDPFGGSPAVAVTFQRVNRIIGRIFSELNDMFKVPTHDQRAASMFGQHILQDITQNVALVVYDVWKLHRSKV